MSLDPGAVEADLVAYYDGEEGRETRPMDPRRLTARAAVIESLAPGIRVLEIGAGPGRDAIALRDAGSDYVGVDLSLAHCRRCRATGAAAVRASVRHLPCRTGSFDLVWSMSTLMHVPDSAIDGALDEVRRVLAPGGRAVTGVWGGRDVEEHSDTDAATGRPPRLFARRSHDRWRAMLGRIVHVEAFEAWDDGHDFVYQWAVVRRD